MAPLGSSIKLNNGASPPQPNTSLGTNQPHSQTGSIATTEAGDGSAGTIINKSIIRNLTIGTKGSISKSRNGSFKTDEPASNIIEPIQEPSNTGPNGVRKVETVSTKQEFMERLRDDKWRRMCASALAFHMMMRYIAHMLQDIEGIESELIEVVKNNAQVTIERSGGITTITNDATDHSLAIREDVLTAALDAVILSANDSKQNVT